VNVAVTGPWRSVELFLRVLSMARTRFTPPTDYRRELEAFPIDAHGYRCEPEAAAGVRLVGRSDAVTLRAGDDLDRVIQAVRRVIPTGAPVGRDEVRSWGQDVLEYVQTVSATIFPPDRPASA